MCECLEASDILHKERCFISNLRISFLNQVDHEMSVLSCFHAWMWLAQLLQSSQTSRVSVYLSITVLSTFAPHTAVIIRTKIAAVFGDAHTVCTFSLVLTGLGHFWPEPTCSIFIHSVLSLNIWGTTCFIVIFSQKCLFAFRNYCKQPISALRCVKKKTEKAFRLKREST